MIYIPNAQSSIFFQLEILKWLILSYHNNFKVDVLVFCLLVPPDNLTPIVLADIICILSCHWSISFSEREIFRSVSLQPSVLLVLVTMSIVESQQVSGEGGGNSLL